MKRPLFVWACSALAATAVFFLCPLPVGIALLTLIGGGSLLLCPKAYRRSVPAMLLAAVLGFSCAALRESVENSRLAPLADGVVTGTLAVREAETAGATCRYAGKAVLCLPNGRALTREVSLTEQSGQSAAIGEALSFSALCRRADAGGISLLLTEALPDRGDAPRLALALSKLRGKCVAAVSRVAFGEGRGVLAALLAGDRSELTNETVRNFRRAGMSHLLVVSGLHLSLAAAFLSLLPALRRRPRLRAVLTLSFVWALALFTGLGVSAVRAALMLSLATAAPLVHRKGDPPTSLAFACLVIVLISPRSILSASLWLSAASTLGILLLSAPLGEALSRRLPQARPFPAAANAFAVSAAALCGTIPVSALAFGTVPLAGLAANLLAVPLLTPTLLLGAVCVLCPPVRPFLSPLCRALLRALGAIARGFACLPLGQLGLSLPWQRIFVAGVYVIAGCAVLLRIGKPLLRRLGLVLAAVFAVCCALTAVGSRCTVTADLLPADGLVLLSRGHRAVLLGAPETPDAAARIGALLDRQNLTAFECVFAPEGLTAAGAALTEGTRTAAVAVPAEQAAGLRIKAPLCEIPSAARVLGCVPIEAGDSLTVLLADEEDCPNGANCVIIGQTQLILGDSARALPPLIESEARLRIPVGRLP